jgi:tellurite resistance protein TerC
MNVSHLEWIITLGVTVAVLLFDVAIVGRRPHEPSMGECALYLTIYVGLAAAFGFFVWTYHGSQFGLEFFAGWITEYSLSADNLLLFVIIMASLAVPKKYQQQALLVGVVLALVFRGVFIGLGAVAINQFSWVFYIFGAFLIYAGFRLGRAAAEDGEVAESRPVRFARRYLNTTDRWDGLKLYVKHGSKRLMTPMFLVILALGTTDIVFALDSIPAIYGLTSQPYLVFTANAFALMGLRQLYFLLGPLLNRLVYLSAGLAVVLWFIGVKQLLHALRLSGVSVPEIPTSLSLGIIALTLVVTMIASAVSSRRHLHRCDDAPGGSAAS